jgi:hypothetical protein
MPNSRRRGRRWSEPTKAFQLKLPQPWFDALEELAKSYEVTKNEMAREAIWIRCSLEARAARNEDTRRWLESYRELYAAARGDQPPAESP